MLVATICENVESDTCSNPLLANLSKAEIPSLNGLRGAAALTVVLYHYLDGTAFARVIPGPFGVTLFFELSGLLITWLLLNEQGRTGHVDLRRFYIRRALRLFPVFYVVWGMCRLSGPFAGAWPTFFYMGDYYHALTQHYNILTVAWSLGVEEKFYLLWPFILTRVERTLLMKILVGVLLAEPVYRAVLTFFGLRAYTWFAFDCRLDAIVLGCLIALAARAGCSAPRWFSHRATPICALILVVALQSEGDLIPYLLAVFLLASISRPDPILNHPLAKYLGAISYSLYLSHPYAHGVLWPRIKGFASSRHWTVELSAELLLALGLASGLHFIVERPFLRFKTRFHARSASTRI
jgi:peptidoglycan/LPS O-acetylase OafA/YrhL